MQSRGPAKSNDWLRQMVRKSQENLYNQHDDDDDDDICIHTHIYIYIYCHPQTDCFVVSQLFSMARHVGRLKLGSKPAQLYVRHSIIPFSQQVYHISSGIIRYLVAFVCLHFIPYQIPECLIHSKSLVLCERQP